jgi:hypothetical protein
MENKEDDEENVKMVAVKKKFKHFSSNCRVSCDP